MKVVAIIQSRMGSTRLPGKILKEVLGKSLLEYQLERVAMCKLVDEIVVATTTQPADRVISKLCMDLKVACTRGSENDVLSRYYEAALKYDADVVVRLTSDCPVIDYSVLDQLISHYIHHIESVDYASNILDRTYPRGLDAEVFSMKVLRIAHLEAVEPAHREHVTLYINQNPFKFKLSGIKNLENLSHYRLTVDTPEDFELIKRILTNIYPKNKEFLLKDIIHVLRENPDWVQLNAHIEQKKI